MARLVLDLGEIEYTEKIIKMEDWMTIKPSKFIIDFEKFLMLVQQRFWDIFQSSESKIICPLDTNLAISFKGQLYG